MVIILFCEPSQSLIDPDNKIVKIVIATRIIRS